MTQTTHMPIAAAPAKAASPVAIQTTLTLMTGLLSLPLLGFGAVALSSQELWAANYTLLVPELVLVMIMMVASLMSVAQTKAVFSQYKKGELNHQATVAMQSWAMMAVMSAMTQIAYAGMIRHMLGCHI